MKCPCPPQRTAVWCWTSFMLKTNGSGAIRHLSPTLIFLQKPTCYDPIQFQTSFVPRTKRSGAITHFCLTIACFPEPTCSGPGQLRRKGELGQTSLLQGRTFCNLIAKCVYKVPNSMSHGSTVCKITDS